MIFFLPQVSSTFKGVSPSDLAERWGDPANGKYCMDIDVAISSEIMEQVMDAQKESRGGGGGGNLADKAKGAVARREQRRALLRGD